MPIKTKKCGNKKHGEELPLECFSKNKREKDGLQRWCKACIAKGSRAWGEKNKNRTHIKIPKEKHCPGCNETLLSENFVKCRFRKDGLSSWCKKCTAKGIRTYHKTNKRRTHIEIPKKKYCSQCDKTKVSKNFSKCKSNKDGLGNHCKECHRKYEKENRSRISQRVRKRYAKNVNFHLGTTLRNRLRKAIKRGQKAGSAVKDLGCTIEEFKVHVEKQFTKDMSWDNYGKWHLDHIKPLILFDLTKRKQFLKACHFSNYQPLWASDNLSKGAKYEESNQA